MTRPWPEKVVDAAISGEPARLPGDRLDDLLAWLLDRDQPGTRLLTEQFEAQGVRREQAVQLSLALLDELLSHGEHDPLACLGFREQPEAETLRRRYRRLQQIFHPDRQFGGEAWATRRAEAINSAYRKIKAGRGSEPGPAVSPPPPETPATADVTAGNGYSYPRRRFADRLRARMGSASKVQRAAVASLLMVSLTGLALTYLGYRSDTSPAVSASDSRPAMADGNLAGRDGGDSAPPQLPVALIGKPDEAVEAGSREHSSSEAGGPDVATNAPVAYGLAASVSAPAERWREAPPAGAPDAALLATAFFLDPPMPGMVRERPRSLISAQGRQAGSRAEPPNTVRATASSGIEPGPAPKKSAHVDAHSGSADGSAAPGATTGGSANHVAAAGDQAAATLESDFSAESDAAPAASEKSEPRVATDAGARSTETVAGHPGSANLEPAPAGKNRGASSGGPQSPATAPDAGAVAAAEGEEHAPEDHKHDSPDATHAHASEPAWPALTDAPDTVAANRVDRSGVDSSGAASSAGTGEDSGLQTGQGSARASGDAVAAASDSPGNDPEQGSERTMATASLDRCRGYSRFLRRYEDAYNRGHLDRLLDLYAHDARENQLKGLSAIAEIYRQFFDDTRGRRIAIAVTGVETREDQCRVQGDYRVNYRTGNGRRRGSDGTIMLHLVDADAGFRIAEIRY